MVDPSWCFHVFSSTILEVPDCVAQIWEGMAPTCCRAPAARPAAAVPGPESTTRWPPRCPRPRRPCAWGCGPGDDMTKGGGKKNNNWYPTMIFYHLYHLECMNIDISKKKYVCIKICKSIFPHSFLWLRCLSNDYNHPHWIQPQPLRKYLGHVLGLTTNYLLDGLYGRKINTQPAVNIQ